MTPESTALLVRQSGVRFGDSCELSVFRPTADYMMRGIAPGIGPFQGIGKDFTMTRRLLGFYGVLTAGIALVPLFSTNLAGQARGKSAALSTTAGLKRTSWGDPDIEGLWTNTTTTPLERLPEAGEKAVLTEDEREALARRVQERLDQDKPGRAGQVVPYNEL